MTHSSNSFGEELRGRRIAADLSLAELSDLVYYSKGQLSKVERDIKKPSRELARLCDAALSANGALISLASNHQPEVMATSTASDGAEVWLLPVPTDGQNWPLPISRRQAIGAGVLFVPGAHVSHGRKHGNRDDGSLPEIFRIIFDQYRCLGQRTYAGPLLPVMATQTHALLELSRATTSNTQRKLLLLAARYAEYVGWLAQEAGDNDAALRWTLYAADLGNRSGDPDLAAYGLVRHALVTLYNDDAQQTIEFARRAQEMAPPSRIRGLAAQREAQGHALAGDYDSCVRCLDRAQVMLSQEASGGDMPVIGTTNLSSPAEMIKGWCLYDLGRPRAAAEVIDAQLAMVPRDAVRTRVRYGARLALAHAAAGEVDHACQLTASLLDDDALIRSATIRKDLHALSRTLARHPKNPSVRDLAPRLGTTLQTEL